MKKLIIISFVVVLITIVGTVSIPFLSQMKIMPEKAEKDKEPVDSKHPIATVKLKGYTPMTFELYPENAPESVNNFIYLADEKFYDGLTMHRVVSDFVAQGGDPDGNGSGGPGYGIKGEFSSNNVENPMTHEKGAIAWARSTEVDSAGSQFYICLSNQDSLNEDYAVFGYMLTGWDTLAKLNDIKVDENDKPVEELTIESVSVDTKGTTYKEPKKLNEVKTIEEKYFN